MSDLSQAKSAARDALAAVFSCADDCVSYPWMGCTCVVGDAIDRMVDHLAGDPKKDPIAKALHQVAWQSIVERGRRKNAQPSP